MSSKIRILPEDLCNKIAAGEVVERPASVVKELLENALDAEATEISVEIEAGGKRLIRVADDGCGMDRDDILLCLERHATSKIGTIDDLFEPRALGFRGEALPSIAAVSRMTLRSRAREQEEGWLVYAEGGQIRKAEPQGVPEGTVIEVRDLFFNTPARKKFMRRESTELGRVSEVVGRLALAFPRVQFRLRHQGRSLLDLYRHKDILERAVAYFGSHFIRDLIKIDRKSPTGLSLTGLIAQPAVHRPSSQGIFTYVNRRFVRDRVIQHALRDGYRHLVPQGRFPVAVLFLDLDPRRVDVNVHPTKHEVKFAEQKEVHDFIAGSVREALRPSGWLDGTLGEEPLAEKRPGIEFPGYQGPEEAAGNDARQRIADSVNRYAATASTFGVEHRRSLDGSSSARSVSGAPPEEGSEGLFSGMTLVGQFAGNYILAQDGEDLVAVDQHAAHERIGFEKLRKQFHQGAVESQQLLFPVVIELDPAAASLLRDHLPEIHRVGIEIDPFGGQSFVVKAVPPILRNADIERLVGDVACDLDSLERSGAIEEEIDSILVTMACHGVIRSGQKLTPPEMSALLRELDQVDFRAHCPHGRPVMHRWTRAEFEKLFQRT